MTCLRRLKEELLSIEDQIRVQRLLSGVRVEVTLQMTLALTKIFDALVLLLYLHAGAHCADAAPGPSALTIRGLLV